MGILAKMLGTKIFLLLSLSVLGYSIPQPEMKIIIHLHQDEFQPGPAPGPALGPAPGPEADYGDYGELPETNGWKNGYCVSNGNKPKGSCIKWKKKLFRKFCTKECNKERKLKRRRATGCEFRSYFWSQDFSCTVYTKCKIKQSGKYSKKKRNGKKENRYHEEQCLSF